MILQICVWNPWNKACLLALSELLMCSGFFCLCRCCDNYILSAIVLQICVWNPWNETCLLALSELFMCSYPGVRSTPKRLLPIRFATNTVIMCDAVSNNKARFNSPVNSPVVVPGCDDTLLTLMRFWINDTIALLWPNLGCVVSVLDLVPEPAVGFPTFSCFTLFRQPQFASSCIWGSLNMQDTKTGVTEATRSVRCNEDILMRRDMIVGLIPDDLILKAISESNAFHGVWDFLMINKRSHSSEFCWPHSC